MSIALNNDTIGIFHDMVIPANVTQYSIVLTSLFSQDDGMDLQICVPTNCFMDTLLIL